MIRPRARIFYISDEIKNVLVKTLILMFIILIIIIIKIIIIIIKIIIILIRNIQRCLG